MKLSCDLCGGTLSLKNDGQAAVCRNCGLEYSLEVLRQKLQPEKSAQSEVQASESGSVSEENAVSDVKDEPAVDSVGSKPGSTRDGVLEVWQKYLPQAMPGYSLVMSINKAMKGCYLAPGIPEDCAKRASRYLTKGKVAPQDILGHYSFKPQGGLAGIVAATDRMFLPVGKLGMTYLEIVYDELSRAEAKKEGSHKIRTEAALLTYANELTLFYKNGQVKTYTTNAQYNAGAIAAALNELVIDR